MQFRAAFKVWRTREGIAFFDEARDKMRRALEKAGVEFIPENGGGAGVRLARPATT